ncbi:MAG: metallophosphoesterase, partial [Candidatus Diapherotrites archaeon]
MKLAVFSDMHLGYGKGSDRFNEAFSNAGKCFEMAVEKKADAILLVGDLFNEPIPSIEVLEKAFELFSIP